MSKRIAIAGAGISGLGAAWMLKESGFDVTVFEPRPVAGGQMEWFETTNENGNKIVFDMYIVCLANSHNMRALGEKWNLPVEEYDYGVYYANGDQSWGNIHHSKFLLEHKEECERFVNLLRELYEENASFEAGATTIQDFLENNGFSDDFTTHILCPLLATLLDAPKEKVVRFTIGAFVEIFATGLLSFLNLTRMYRFINGISDPVMALAGALEGNIQYNNAVQSIERKADQVLLLDSHGNTHFFDDVILSCDFQKCLGMMGDATTAEKNVLGGINYNYLRLLIHSDPSVFEVPGVQDSRLISVQKGNTISNQVFISGQKQTKHPGLLGSGVMGNVVSGIDSDKVLCERIYPLEFMTLESTIAKAHIRFIQGVDHIWYCGLSTVPGLSECCLVSGFAIAEKLGATYPFEHLPKAKNIFENIKNFMFGGAPSLRLFY